MGEGNLVGTTGVRRGVSLEQEEKEGGGRGWVSGAERDSPRRDAVARIRVCAFPEGNRSPPKCFKGCKGRATTSACGLTVWS